MLITSPSLSMGDLNMFSVFFNMVGKMYLPKGKTTLNVRLSPLISYKTKGYFFKKKLLRITAACVQISDGPFS